MSYRDLLLDIESTVLQLMERFKYGSSSTPSTSATSMSTSVSGSSGNNSSSSSSSSSNNSSSSNSSGRNDREEESNTAYTTSPKDLGLDSTYGHQFDKLATLLRAEKLLTGQSCLVILILIMI